ncbi:MAG: YfhO family protein [Chloroflexi bacterium]|nr:YfhO family protein [Chloroflexota bacterium]
MDTESTDFQAKDSVFQGEAGVEASAGSGLSKGPTLADVKGNEASTRPSSRRVSWPAVFHARGAGCATGPARLPWPVIAREWAVIFVAVLAFCAGFLDLGTQRALPGNESEVFQALDYVLVGSVRDFGQFPLWNPYLHTGLPYAADPMLHAYNPVASLPVLLFGVLDGFKVALFLSFLAAGLGMWWLGYRLDMGSAGRLWVALMYAFTGQAAARFMQGQYLFILGFAWIPWALAALWSAVQTRRRRYVGIAVVTLALLCFSGNIYYPYYMVFVVAGLALVTAFDVRLNRKNRDTNDAENAANSFPVRVVRVHPRPALRSSFLRLRPVVTFRREPVLILLLIAVLTTTLVAVQLLPLAEFWPHIAKPTNPALTDSQTIRQVFLDLLSKDPARADALQTVPPQDFYGYAGVGAFLALLLLPLAAWQRERRPLVFFGLLLVFVLLWIDVKDLPWRGLFVGNHLLAQFRYPTRMLIFGAVAVIALAGLGLDTLWRLTWRVTALRKLSVPELARWIGTRVTVALLIGFMVWSVADVFIANRKYVRTRDPYPPSSEVMRWLRDADAGVYYVGNTNGWHGSLLSAGLRYIDAWYHFADIRQVKDVINVRPVQARANYVAQGNDQPLPQPDGAPVQKFAGHTVYRLPHSLPYAFAVTDQVLADPASGRELRREDVTPLQPAVATPNRVEIAADGAAGEKLVLCITSYPGWSVTVDGQPAKLVNVGGYLATALQPGAHRYVFSFAPVTFKIGLIISILSLLGLAGLFTGDRWARPWAARRRRIRTGGVYTGGVLAPDAPLDLADGTRVRLTVEPRVAAAAARTASAPPGAPQAQRRARTVVFGWVLFALAMLVYAITRFWALDKFPIYFFADEATHAVLAGDLLARGLKDAQGHLLPLYFEAAGLRWTPLLSVYVHILPVLLFGKTVLVTRATSAVVSLLAAAAVALILKLIFKARYWWVGALLMAIAPAWFLHSRTGFETVMMSSFYGCFLLFYLLYRTRSPRCIFPAMIFGAATFYTYSNGQMIMAAAGALLLLSDFLYHLKNWRTNLLAVALIALLAVPFLAFRASQPNSLPQHLRAIDSYWFRAIPLQEKVTRFAQTYAYGLSPQYWFVPNEYDLARHRMQGYGNLNLPVLPLLLLGVGLCLWKVKSSPHRAVILAALATPAGAALVDISITRVLAFIVPASILAGIGLDAALGFVERKLRARHAALAVVTFAVFGAASFGMLNDALTRGPLWYNDYGLYGMQYGAKQLFEDTIPVYLKRDPNTLVLVSSTWANGADTFIRFFLPPEQRPRVQMLNVDYFMSARRTLTPNMLLVMTPNEYEQAKASKKFKSVTVEQVIPYPDGRPGFYFARLAYADNLDAIIADEKAVRSKPVVEQFVLDGQQVQVSHSQFDAGQLRDLFDGDPFTLARGLEANPLVLEFTFPQPRPMTGLAADFGSMDFTLTAQLTADGATAPVAYSQTFRGLPPDPHVELAFERGPAAVKKLRLEILQLNAGNEVHIHVRELKFK